MARYSVEITKKVAKRLDRLPAAIQQALFQLIEDLREQGPMPKGWSNLSKLLADNYHCHLAYSWVACWSYEKKSRKIEVYYAGSRKDAPY